MEGEVTTGQQQQRRMLLVDNYDSYTYNLYQYIGVVTGAAPLVIKNHDPRSRDAAFVAQFSGVVISPGPGHPAIPNDIGVCSDLLELYDGPILGVCLGFQAMGLHNGCSVIKAPRVVHGEVATVVVKDPEDELMKHLPPVFTAVRYHSLMVDPSSVDPTRIKVTAAAPECNGARDIPMALKVVGRRQWGVQYHPESVCTKTGMALLTAFAGVCGWGPAESWVLRTPPGYPEGPPASSPAISNSALRTLEVVPVVLPKGLDTRLEAAELVFEALYGGGGGGCVGSAGSSCCWLDSSDPRGRYSVMADSEHAGAFVVEKTCGGGRAVASAVSPSAAAPNAPAAASPALPSAVSPAAAAPSAVSPSAAAPNAAAAASPALPSAVSPAAAAASTVSPSAAAPNAAAAASPALPSAVSPAAAAASAVSPSAAAPNAAAVAPSAAGAAESKAPPTAPAALPSACPAAAAASTRAVQAAPSAAATSTAPSATPSSAPSAATAAAAAAAAAAAPPGNSEQRLPVAHADPEPDALAEMERHLRQRKADGLVRRTLPPVWLRTRAAGNEACEATEPGNDEVSNARGQAKGGREAEAGARESCKATGTGADGAAKAQEQAKGSRTEAWLEGVAQAELPFMGGFLGYVGYEMRAECAAKLHGIDPGSIDLGPAETGLDVPDLFMLFVERFAVLDHDEGVVYLCDTVSNAAGGKAAGAAAGNERRRRSRSSSSSSSSSGSCGESAGRGGGGGGGRSGENSNNRNNVNGGGSGANGSDCGGSRSRNDDSNNNSSSSGSNNNGNKNNSNGNSYSNGNGKINGVRESTSCGNGNGNGTSGSRHNDNSNVAVGTGGGGSGGSYGGNDQSASCAAASSAWLALAAERLGRAFSNTRVASFSPCQHQPAAGGLSPKPVQTEQGLVGSTPAEAGSTGKVTFTPSPSREKSIESSVAGSETCQHQPAADDLSPKPVQTEQGTPAGKVTFTPSQSREEYIGSIAESQRHILDGDTYEVCLTNQFDCPVAASVARNPLDFYKKLRKVNGAPYSAFISVHGRAAVCSSSPERFLKVGSDGWAEAKPIKGTIRRDLSDPVNDEALKEELRSSEKDQCENLMIADLLRNDLGMLCELGSVTVPSLMAIETYKTVHQMVTTVRGKLHAKFVPTDALTAAFPGGSIVGAPKLRTMEIIQALERRRRGVYTGSIGYLSVHGSCDLNIAIRTAVIAQPATPNSTPHDDGRGFSLRIGAGGAITVLSDPAAEWDEIMIKAYPVMRAVAAILTGDENNFEVDL